MSSKLDRLTPLLKKAVGRLQEALEQPPNAFIRDSAVQRFEFTYELVWKTLQAHLLEEKAVAAHSPKDCLKEAFAAGVIDDDPLWLETARLRNLTSHTYNEKIADEIFQALPRILALYRDLLERLGRP